MTTLVRIHVLAAGGEGVGKDDGGRVVFVGGARVIVVMTILHWGTSLLIL